MAAPNRLMEHSFRLRSQPGRLGRIRGRTATLGHPGFVTGQCRHIQPVRGNGTNDILHLSGHFHYFIHCRDRHHGKSHPKRA